MSKLLGAFASIALVSAIFCSCLRSTEPQLYLTWDQDQTSSGMSIHFHDRGKTRRNLNVHYGLSPGQAVPDRYSTAREMTATFSEAGSRYIYTAELADLSPDKTYYFVVSDAASGSLTREERFRTVPQSGEIRFIVGADMGMGSVVDRLQTAAASHDPMFAVIGGDVVYDDGDPTKAHFWDEWLSSWSDHMRRTDGSMVPIVMAIGNHEVQGGYGGSPDRAPIFRDYFFPSENRTYYSRHFAGHTAIYILDTDHIASIDGPQKDWMQEAMATDQSLANRFAAYHVPLYPSVRNPDEGVSARARHIWGPIFDQFRLTIGFEHHDHSLKRTYPMKRGVPSPDGTLYLGDGCFGTKTRDVAGGRSYIARSESVRHFWKVTASADRVRMEAFDGSNRLRDSAEILR